MKRKTKLQGLYFLVGLALSTLPVVISTLMYFPLWQARGSLYTLSGLTALLLILAAIPSIRIIKKWLKSPSATFIWLIIFLLFLALSRIAQQVTVIAFYGFIGNFFGSFFFKLSRGRGMDTSRLTNGKSEGSGRASEGEARE